MHPPKVPFAHTCEIRVQLPDDDLPKCDGYIDNAFMAFLLHHHNRGAAVLPFVIHLLGCPVHPLESDHRADLLSLSKFLGEATPAESKTILGWQLNTRRLLIVLLEHKYIAWSNDIKRLLASLKVGVKDLESTIGRLNHVGFIIPLT
jgi:hypothetical protein